MAAQRTEPDTFLALLSDGDRDALLTFGGPRKFARGAHLMHQGEPGDRVLILHAGHVKASSVDARGREMVLSFRGPGDVLGELTFTHGEPRSSNVIAIEPVEAHALASSEFRVYLEQRPTAALTLIDVISRRFRDANRKRAQFSELDTIGRIAARLIELCERTGYKLRKSTSTIVDYGGANLTTSYTYDPVTGQQLSRTLPKGAPATPSTHTTKTTLYTAAAGSGSCAGKPAWAGLPCRTEPAAQPGGSLPDLPTRTITYNRWEQPAVSTETVAGTHSRTTTIEYDPAGRAQSETVTATGSNSGSSLPAVTHEYDPSTGRETTLKTGPSKKITRQYDSLGRLVSYQDADGNTTTTSYDVRDRPTTTNDGKGAQAYYYSDNTGRLTSMVDSDAGQFQPFYDADGNITTEVLPGNLADYSYYDEAGNRFAQYYYKYVGPCGSSCNWSFQYAYVNAHDQLTWQYTVNQDGSIPSADNYSFDKVGRLTSTLEVPSNHACTLRRYTFDDDSNRTNLNTASLDANTCTGDTTGTDTGSAYDSADRANTTGYDYDAFGRTLTVPAASAGGHALTSTYYVDDTARSISQDGLTQTYDLDPAGRTSVRTTSGTSTATETSHYSDDSDSPAWLDTGSSSTRQIQGPDGDLAAVRDNTGTRLQLTNLHGDVIAEASVDVNATAPLHTSTNDEFGVPAVQQSGRNQWLGGKQRSTELPSGVISMGARTYVPAVGRFMQTDPVAGGSANSYDYANQEPLNTFDLDGRKARIEHLIHVFDSMRIDSNVVFRFLVYGKMRFNGRHLTINWRIKLTAGGGSIIDRRIRCTEVHGPLGLFGNGCGDRRGAGRRVYYLGDNGRYRFSFSYFGQYNGTVSAPGGFDVDATCKNRTVVCQF